MASEQTEQVHWTAQKVFNDGLLLVSCPLLSLVKICDPAVITRIAHDEGRSMKSQKIKTLSINRTVQPLSGKRFGWAATKAFGCYGRRHMEICTKKCAQLNERIKNDNQTGQERASKWHWSTDWIGCQVECMRSLRVGNGTK
jgi:hypothetical protein